MLQINKPTQYCVNMTNRQRKQKHKYLYCNECIKMLVYPVDNESASI